MRILFIHNRYQQRGGEDVAVELESELLRDRGHQVQVLYFENDHINPLRAVSNSKSYREVSEGITKFQPDVAHVHNLFFEATPSILRALAVKGIPVVMTIHNYRLICANALLLRDGRPCELCVEQKFPTYGIRFRCYRNSMAASAMVVAITGAHKIKGTWKNNVDKYIFLTDFSKSRFIGSSLEVGSEKMVVKPNFVKDIGGGGDRGDFFLFVGRLSEEKGIDVLVKAIKGFKLVVAGAGPNLTAENAEITFTGQLKREQVMDLMKRAKALIFPSIWYEGLPFTILEAFSVGTPVIASNLGSMAEMIQHGYNGFHFEAGNAGDLREKLNLFDQLSDQQRQELSVNARNTYLTKYHPDVHYSSIISIYESVVHEKRQKRNE
ncbi:MAG TPA: glycosyltransferase family 4 protein [Chitinophagaceae bacterium]|nr:glycosyltransferase family 4 protein [Chitinophagaceae bacterium]